MCFIFLLLYANEDIGPGQDDVASICNGSQIIESENVTYLHEVLSSVKHQHIAYVRSGWRAKVM